MQLDFKIVKNDLITIIICSLILRVLYLYFVEGVNLNSGEDDEHYYNIALEAANNGLINWNSHDRPPLISLIIVPIIKITSGKFTLILVKFLMILLSVSTGVALYFLSIEVTKNSKISLIISIIFSLYPYSIFISTRLYTENLAALLICLIALFLIKFFHKPKNKFLIVASFLMGLLSLTRSSYFYLPFFISILIFFTNTNFLKKIIFTIKIFIIFFITLSPWIIKNYIQLNDYVPTTTRLGYGLWLTNNDFDSNLIKKGGYERTEQFKKEILFSEKFDPIRRSNYLKEKALEEIKNNKLEFLKACIFRFVNFFNPKPNPYKNFSFKDLAMIFYYTPLLVIFFTSLFKQYYKFDKIVLLIIIFYALITHLPFYGFPRFRFPVDSLIFLISISFLFEKTNDISFSKLSSLLKFFRE